MKTHRDTFRTIRFIVGALVIIAVFLAGFASHSGRFFPYEILAPLFGANGAGTAGKEARTADTPSIENIEGILTIPYISSAPVKSGETPKVYNNPKLSYNGLSLYNSRERNRAVLVDMDGSEVYSWSSDRFDSFHQMELAPNGDLYVVEKNTCVAKLDKDSNILWRFETLAHHDLDIDDNGNIFAISRRYRDMPYFSANDQTVEDYILVLSPEGEKIREISVLKMVVNSEYFYLLPVVNRLKLNNPADLMHTNSIELFDGSLEHLSPLLRKGNALLSMRNINLVCIVDLEKEKIVWAWGPGNINRQHHPSLLDNGNMLIFDNGLKYSRAIELDPFNMKLVWEFGASKKERFFSVLGGGAQRLPNGNTLITNYDAGTVIEVTPSNEVVWRFVNPDVTENESGGFERGKIYRMTRFSRDDLDFLK